MTSGTPRRRISRRGFGCLLAAAVAGLQPIASHTQPAAPAAENTFDLDALLSLLARRDTSSLHATFHERKFVKQLDAPVDSSGELSFEAPATMVMRRIEPRPETMRLDGRTLTLERGRQRRTLALDEHPEIAIYIEAVRAALAGDEAALERHYRSRVEGDAENWRLTLVPQDARLAAQVSRIVLSGRSHEVRQVEVRLADGDYSVMNIEPAAITSAPAAAAAR